MQMIHIFDYPAFMGSGNGNIIDHRKMLDIFTQTYATGMGADGQIVFCGHQHNSKDFIDPTQTAGVDLNHIYRAFHDELLEHDPVLAHFASSDLHIANRCADFPVPGNIVGACRFFDEPRLCKTELVHPVDGLIDLPDLIGVDHQVPVRPDCVARYGEAANVIFKVAANLQLDVVETGINGFLAKPAQLVVGIAKPACGCGVAGVAIGLEIGDASGFAGLSSASASSGVMQSVM